MLFTTTTYDAATSGGVINQVEDVYNGFGQLVTEYQEHSGVVNTSTSLKTQYSYSDGDLGSRLTGMVYPDGGTLTYSYGASNGLNDVIGRLDALKQGTLTLESYKYLGLSTVVEWDHPETGVNLTYIAQGTEINGVQGDKYNGLDNFGRVVDQRRFNGSTDVDRYKYDYDRDGNVTQKWNTNFSGNTETYTYDGLNRLTATNRTAGTANDQSWTLDALGNMTSVTTNGSGQSRTINSGNELTASGGADIAYDDNGNMLNDTDGHKFIYDAWNRLVEVTDSDGNFIEAFTYDGLGRRTQEWFIQEIDLEPTDLYYDSRWQILDEMFEQDTTNVRNVWSPTYVNALVIRERNTDIYSDSTYDERLYFTYDANYSTTSIIASSSFGSGTVEQRMSYTSYGVVTFMNASWSTQDDAYAMRTLYQGMHYNVSFGDYDSEERIYAPSLERWLTADPILFAGGGPNFYEFVGDNPIILRDPTGLDANSWTPGTREGYPARIYTDGYWLLNSKGNAFKWVPNTRPADDDLSKLVKNIGNALNDLGRASFGDIRSWLDPIGTLNRESIEVGNDLARLRKEGLDPQINDNKFGHAMQNSCC